MASARLNSNVFAMFDQRQIAELKEAFTFIDSNADGLIDKEDLRDIWSSLGTLNVFFMRIYYFSSGQDPSDEMLEGMLGSTGPLNFTLYLTLMGEKIQAASLGSDSELMAAFEAYDEQRTGFLPPAQLREILGVGVGTDVLTEHEVSDH